MSKKLFAVMILVIFAVVSIQGNLFAAEQKTANKTAPKTAAVDTKNIAKPNFGMIAGTIVNIDTTDPNNIKLQIKSDADGAIRNIIVTPWTNVTKVTDPSELKTGDTVRLMTKKDGDKEVAMGIMFGKIKNIMPPPVARKPMAPVDAVTKAKK